jgi:hypothetical protein
MGWEQGSPEMQWPEVVSRPCSTFSRCLVFITRSLLPAPDSISIPELPELTVRYGTVLLMLFCVIQDVAYTVA